MAPGYIVKRNHYMALWRKKSGFLSQLLLGVSVLHWLLRLLLILAVADLFYLTIMWPEWRAFASGPVPKSKFISDYQAKRAHDRSLPPVRWQPVPLSEIPRHMVRAVILAEDSRFYQHSGFDLIAFKEAMSYNWTEGEFALGASTISQQTAKNLFLSQSRTPWRKWHELVLTWGMEQNVSKRRILELYLNVAEFGPGVYGVQAAAHTYYGTSVSKLSVTQAAELAASLPGPGKHNPATRTAYFQKRTHKIMGFLMRFPGDAAEAVSRELAVPLPDDEPAAVEPETESESPASADDVTDAI
jgi:monofunctional glycosyltransferase